MESASRPHLFLNGATVTLFVALLIAAVTFSGVSSVVLAHLFLILAFAVSVVIVLTEIVPNKSRKQKALLIGLSGIILLAFDRLLLYLKAASLGTASNPTSLVQSLGAVRTFQWGYLLVGGIVGALAAGTTALLIFRRDQRRRQHLLLAEGLAPKVDILSPGDNWSVGLRQTVRGSVFPPESSTVQLLVSPIYDGWYLVDDVTVNGGAWSSNYRFEKPGISYQIVAIHGDSLKQQKYDHLPSNVVMSKIIRIVRGTNENRIDCPDNGLHQTKIDDKTKIKDLVMVCIISCRTEINAGDPHVNLTFHLLNMSLYLISLESVKGSIGYSQSLNPVRQRILLRLPLSVVDAENQARHIPFRQTGSFKVCQPLTKENADVIEPMEGLFRLDDLIITIKGDESEPVVIPTGTPYIQKDRDWNASSPESYFMYRDTVRAEANLRTVEAERDALRELVEKKVLPEDSGKK